MGVFIVMPSATSDFCGFDSGVVSGQGFGSELVVVVLGFKSGLVVF